MAVSCSWRKGGAQGLANINLGMALLALFIFGLLIRLIEAVASYLPLIIGVSVFVFVAWKIFSIYRADALEAASGRRAVIHQGIAKELFIDLSIEVFEFSQSFYVLQDIIYRELDLHDEFRMQLRRVLEAGEESNSRRKSKDRNPKLHEEVEIVAKNFQYRDKSLLIKRFMQVPDVRAISQLSLEAKAVKAVDQYTKEVKWCNKALSRLDGTNMSLQEAISKAKGNELLESSLESFLGLQESVCREINRLEIHRNECIQMRAKTMDFLSLAPDVRGLVDGSTLDFDRLNIDSAHKESFNEIALLIEAYKELSLDSSF